MLFSRCSTTKRVPGHVRCFLPGHSAPPPSLPPGDVLHYRTLNGRFPRQWAPSATSLEISFVPIGHNDSPASRGPGAKDTSQPLPLEYTHNGSLFLHVAGRRRSHRRRRRRRRIGPPGNWDTLPSAIVQATIKREGLVGAEFASRA